MSIKNIKLEEITEEIKDLLLSADPDFSKIEKYLGDSQIYILQKNKENIGVLVLKQIDKHISEIMNIAVKEKYRGNGYGRKLLEHSGGEAKAAGSKYLKIETGNSSINQISIYQKFGFRFHEIVEDFFKDYNGEITENGIKCIDMIRFRKEL